VAPGRTWRASTEPGPRWRASRRRRRSRGSSSPYAIGDDPGGL
ncbi:MAG: hypothetical protein AVDCRST_MAG70-591, partial [uncultured Thermomicrobiales bacterium]